MLRKEGAKDTDCGWTLVPVRKADAIREGNESSRFSKKGAALYYHLTQQSGVGD